MRTLAERERRLRVVRIVSDIEVALGTFAVALPIVWLVVEPPPRHGLTYVEPAWRLPIEIIAYVGIVIGYLLMLRIRFTGPEDGARSNWRSH